MFATTHPRWIRPIGPALVTSVAALGLLCDAREMLAQVQVGRSPIPEASGQWVADVQREWEASGAAYFESVPADRPHATIVLKDLADRTGVGAFDIWVLVDGARVRDWTASSPLRVSPGAHCIRIDMVAPAQQYQGTLNRSWPWLPAGFTDEIQLVRDSERRFAIKYQRVTINVKGLLDAGEAEYSRNRPSDPAAAYTYCLAHVRERQAR